MLTTCPNPDCIFEFEILEQAGDSASLEKRGHLLGICPSCGLEAAFRSMEAQAIIEREFEKRKGRNALSGGPHGDDSDYIAPRAVLVEDVRSLWNIGSIFRTSDGAGFSQIFLCGISGSPPRREIEKVSLGAEQHVTWHYRVNPLSVIGSLNKQGVQIVGLEKTASSRLLARSLQEGEIGRPMCLIVGNEVSGLSPQVLSACHLVCHLPMTGMKESLNVAVAYGIAAYMIASTPV